MRRKFALLLACLPCVIVYAAAAAAQSLGVPKTVEAGSAFTIQTNGSGKASLYIVGLGQVLMQDVQLGNPVSIAAGTLYNAGHYVAIVTGGSVTDYGSFDVVPAKQVANISFLAKPSRLPVGLHNGIAGTVYVFDAYHNLITVPTPVSFALSIPSGTTEQHTVVTKDGAAWTEMDSSPKEGNDKFVASADGVSTARVIEQVPGDPCGLKMTAQPDGKHLQLKTAPVVDCTGNAVPDGTIVTFTETYNGTQTTVDVPLKRGIAEVEMPAYNGARISVASGVVMGNDIRWGR